MPLKVRSDSKKAETERLQALVLELLREEENKYCADCEAKQPRWASWNLGIFLCIRCAGIHRNLGVHLTKVKSVNLDSWTAEQVQSMRVMGNKMARRVYEAELPDYFRRPQTDSALESFIRAKYEHKRYIMKDWTPSPVNIKDLPLSLDKRHSIERNVQEQKTENSSNISMKVAAGPGKQTIISNRDINNEIPLLDLDSPVTNEIVRATSPKVITDPLDCDGLEDFGPIVSASSFGLSSFSTDQSSSKKLVSSMSENNLEDLTSVLGSLAANDDKKTNSDILALYQTNPSVNGRQPIRPSLIEVNVCDNSNKYSADTNSVLKNTNFEKFYNSSLIKFSTPASGLSDSERKAANTNASSGDNLIMNEELNAAFAASSPFANNSKSIDAKLQTSSTVSPIKNSKTSITGITSQSTGIYHSQMDKNLEFYDLFSSGKKEVNSQSIGKFVADFSQINIRSDHEQGKVQSNVLWN